MSIGLEQAVDASVFLTLYKEAIQTLEESAKRDVANETIQIFTDRMLNIVDVPQYRKFFNPKQAIPKDKQIGTSSFLRDLRCFQYSQYLFSKYLPKFLSFEGTSKELISYMEQQTDLLERDANK